MHRTNASLALAVFAIVAFGCAEKKTTPTPSPDTREQAKTMQQVDVTTSAEFAKKHTTFDAYWYRGLAELSRYELKQSRYGEIHDGEAVLVFVTEPFLTDKQVKYEGGDKTNAEQVFKLNNHRRFYTGVYPYSLLTSTFTPAKRDGPTIKLTHSVQEWCGHVFAQANLQPSAEGYDVQSFSYFMNEGDQKFPLSTTMLEDELLSRVRMGPEKLPQGEIQLLPSATFLRLMHKRWEPATATATLGEAKPSNFSDEPVRSYTVQYPTLDRTLTIYFEPDFPYRIVGWTEEGTALFNRDGGAPEKLVTTARLTESIMLDYWSKNSVADAPFRDALGLQY